MVELLTLVMVVDALALCLLCLLFSSFFFFFFTFFIFVASFILADFSSSQSLSVDNDGCSEDSGDSVVARHKGLPCDEVRAPSASLCWGDAVNRGDDGTRLPNRCFSRSRRCMPKIGPVLFVVNARVRLTLSEKKSGKNDSVDKIEDQWVCDLLPVITEMDRVWLGSTAQSRRQSKRGSSDWRAERMCGR